MRMRLQLILISVLIVLGLVSMSVYTVYETDRAILIRLGDLVKDTETNKPQMYGPGLHFKLPFIDVVRIFDTRLNMHDIKSSRIFTVEKKYVLVDFFVQWRIDDLALFYTRTDGQKFKAEKLLEDKVVAGLKAEFGKRTIKEVVSGERIELMEQLRKITDANAENLGIAVIDVRIKRIDLPDEVSDSVYERMRSERLRVANEIRSEGRAEAITKRAQADKTTRILLSEAERKSKRIRGEGDAQAVNIYAAAYNKSPEFYEFYRSIEAYKNTFNNKDDLLLLRPDSDFFKYFKGSFNNK